MGKPKLSLGDYRGDQLPRAEGSIEWNRCEPSSGGRGAQQLNEFYGDWLETDARAIFLGEDIADPYGGAFKVSKGFTTRFPERALTTPISEAAITGVGIGLALTGRRAFVEIMFGDFITLAFDQIVNNASKFFHMYNRKLSCPVIVRAPMGGRRGYGPNSFPIARALSVGHRQLLSDQPELADSAQFATRWAEVLELSGNRRGE